MNVLKISNNSKTSIRQLSNESNPYLDFFIIWKKKSEKYNSQLENS